MNVVKAWYFDVQGNSIKEEFQTEQEAQEFAKNHGLELFKTLTMPKMVYSPVKVK
jgi:hypothetical protein